VFGLGPATRIYLAAGVTDMRNYAPSIDMRTLIDTGTVSLGSSCSARHERFGFTLHNVAFLGPPSVDQREDLHGHF
jgi:hypothetical protein